MPDDISELPGVDNLEKTDASADRAREPRLQLGLPAQQLSNY